MTPLAPEPFFLLDESLSASIVAEVSRVTGYAITTVWDEWPGRDLHINSLSDEEIIPHLGDKAGRLAIWITGDWKAFREHGHLIDAHRISVLWLRGPGTGIPQSYNSLKCYVMCWRKYAPWFSEAMMLYTCE